MSFGTLFVRYSDGRLEIADLEKPTIDVGSAPECDVVLHDSSVEPLHAQLLCEESGCQILDLGSATGTILYGQRLPPDEPIQLGDKAALQIGAVSLVYRLPLPEPSPQPALPPPLSAPARRSRPWGWYILTGVLSTLLVISTSLAVRNWPVPPTPVVATATPNVAIALQSPTTAPTTPPVPTASPTAVPTSVPPTPRPTATSAPTSTPTGPPSTQYVVNTAGQQRLLIRSAPGRTSPVVGQLPNGAVVRAVGEPVVAGGLTWVQIEGEDVRGWCTLAALRRQ